LLGGVLGAAYYLDPGRPLRELERAAARGPVTLIGPLGPPRYFRIRTGGAATQVAVAPDGAWTVHSRSHCCIELLPDPGHHEFRFSVEVQHDQSDGGGVAGIYVGGQACPRLPQDDRLMVILEYNDITLPAPRIAPPKVPPNVKIPFRSENVVLLGPWYLGHLPNGVDYTYRLPGTSGPTFVPAAQKLERRYRLLEITVASDHVAGQWDSQSTKPLKLGRYTGSVIDHKKGMQAKWPGDEHLDAIPLTFNPRGAVGLSVQHGSARFRNATITPLGEAE
jgi:hypothetical protein